MAHSAGPLISLAVSSTTKKSHTPFGPAALSLAAEFNRELVRSNSDADKAKICRTYRDTIMRISMWADDIAAAFTDAFAPFLQRQQPGDDTEAWKSFASLAQRSQQARRHDGQRTRHQTAIVAIWGAEVFEHYGWHELSLDNTKRLRAVACTQRQWKLAVKLINSVMLERHELRVLQHDNRSPLIGEHPHGSKIQDHRSPVQRRDIVAVAERLRKDKGEVISHEQRKGGANTIAGTPIRKYGLETDKYGMIVPRGVPGINRDTSSPTYQASKRRKMEHNTFECRGSKDLATAPTSPRLNSPSISTPVSELTQFEEESCDDTANAGLDRDVRRFPTDRELRSDTRPAEHLTPDEPPTAEVLTDLCHETLHDASSHQSHRSIQSSRREYTDQSPCPPEDMQSDAELPIHQSTEVTVEPGMEDNAKGEDVFMSNSQLTDCGRSCEPSYREDSPDTAVLMSNPGHPGRLSNAEESQRCLFSSSSNLELLSPASTRGLPKAVNTGSDCNAGHVCQQESPAVRPSDVDIRLRESKGSEEDLQVEGESDAEFFNPGDIAALEEATRMGGPDRSHLLEVHSDPLSSVQCTPSHWKDNEVMPNVEASASPTPCQGFIPAPVEGSIPRYCTDVNIDDDGTILGRMAHCYSSRLRDLLESARKYSTDRRVEEHNKVKVAWLERTRWANVSVVPQESDPNLNTPLDADVLYMESQTFQKRAQTGEIFSRPIVIKQKFSDSGMHEPHDYISILKEKFQGQELDVQNSETGECRKMDVQDFYATRSSAEKADHQALATTSNVINLRKTANADAPLLTRMRRFRLLETLVDRAAKLGPGKRISGHLNDISDCLGFDLLGFEGAFTRPHVDALTGTWARCLSGEKAWIFAPGMGGEDWDGFAREGAYWSPAGKGRVIILEKDDVLFMPPGLRTLHAVFTLGSSLMEGGMLWDEYNIPALLDELLWVAQNQACTNEAIAYQLPSIIDTLEIWTREHDDRLSIVRKSPDYIQIVERGIRRLRDLGCRCVRGCTKTPGCPCSIQRRRCTAWCLKHPTLPGQAKGQAHHCMYEA
jgi:hypothetical protein